MRMMAALAALAMTSWAAAVASPGTPPSTTPSANAATASPSDHPPATAPAPAWGKPIKTEINPGQMVTYPSTNRDIQAYFVTPKLPPPAVIAVPADGSPAPTVAPMPSIIYVHDIFGMTDFAKSQADALARQGYAVLVPNLYTRLENSEKGFDAQSAWIAYDKTPDLQVKQDLLAAIDYLQAEGKPTANQPLAIVGHDMGGIYAMMIAASDLRVTAAVNYYGRILYPNITPARPSSPVEDLFNLRAPLLSFYGNEDPQIPREQVKALESRLAHNPNHAYYEVVQLPHIGHGFLVPGRQGFNAQAASSSEEKTRDFLARYLRAEPKKAEE